MQRIHLPAAIIALIVLNLIGPSSRGAATDASRPFATPNDVLTAASNAYAHKNFDRYFDCFSTGGQKQQVTGIVEMFTGLIQIAEGTEAFELTGPNGEKIPATTLPTTGPSESDRKMVKNLRDLLARYGITDFKKHDGETDDQQADRLATQLENPRGFFIAACILAESTSSAPPRRRGS